jgi:hypothetical protein
MKRFLSILPLLLLPIVFLSPNVVVKWAQDRKGFSVEFEQKDEQVAECIQSGLEVRYRLEYRVCRRRQSWLDNCSDQQLISRSVQYDPVSESYSIKTDSLADSSPAATVMETDADLAMAKIMQFSINAQVDSLAPYLGALNSENHYISIRLRGYCQREEQSLLTQIPYYLTLGIFRFTGFDSGWVDYNLQ